MRARVVVLALIALAAFGAGVVVAPALRGATDHHEEHFDRSGAKRVYQCSMHPQIVSNEPGNCPICGMKLQLVDDPAAAAGTGAADDPIVFYRHPMRADVTSPSPAKDEMGMDYIPVRKSEAEGGAPAVPGHGSFTLTPERRQLIGVKTAKIEERELETAIRAVGKVAYDPALYRAIVEYREALAARGALGERSLAEAREGADSLVRAARLRLRQLGVADQQLTAMSRGGRAPENLLLPGRSVWVYAQIYEYEADLVRPGQKLAITAPSAPGRTFTAEIAAVDPVLDAATRTIRVRALVSTPDGDLRPESFVDVTIKVPLGRAVALPEDAILDTGERRIVFVAEPGGRFEPREVSVGREAGGFLEVLSGVAGGEEVVTSANFLIDSESRFRAAVAAFGSRGAGTPR